ncbi:hypothetical protein TEA_022278 [Camellia sinensis var. sinensis]|uniref:Uncharacterized protein n=1 Tax=Camellia sinensis var. sinensis TaxID=542762 RepID=A0A4S4EXP6_CAMSN|nr:hypothetical protein TEA_022278 [Camellia sinensis var. sinensis]
MEEQRDGESGGDAMAGRPHCGDSEVSDYPNYKPENEDYDNLYTGTENLGGENGERSRFNAGGRVGVGIGLSICVGIGIGVSLLPRTYQGTCQKLQKAAIIAYTILLVVVEALIRNGTSNNIRIIAAFPPLDFVGNSRL